MKKNRYHTLLFILIGMLATAQIKIGPSLPVIRISSLLELEDANKGLLLPRVALTNTTSSQPLAGHVLGMIVYNTVTTNDVLSGVYINNGSKWELKSDPAQASETVSGIINTQAQTLGSGKKTFSSNIMVSSNLIGRDINNNLSNIVFGSFNLTTTIGLDNTAIGFINQRFNTSGERNTSVGNTSMEKITTGKNNTSTGATSFADGIASNNNTCIGVATFSNNSSDNNTTTAGNDTLNGRYTGAGDNNIAVGQSASQGNYSANSTLIGCYAGVNSRERINDIAIGYLSTNGNVSNNVRIGNKLITKLSVQVPWTISSDRRWKSNITTSNLGLDFIKKLHPVSYFRKNDVSQQIEYGFIAQELKKTLKKTGVSNAGILNKDSNGMYQMRYNDFMAPTVKAIQEQQTIIVSQKTVNNDQQKQIDELWVLVNQLTAKK